MIRSLALKNFKGSSVQLSLAAGNLILGRNFSGKTAVDQAVRALILGYIPGVAKTSAGLKMFASDWPMDVSLSLDAAEGIPPAARICFDRVKSSVKQTSDETLAAVIDEQTRALFDPSIFFGLSDDARIAKACELVQSQGGSPDEIAAAIAAIVTPLEGNPDDTRTISEIERQLARWVAEVKPKAATVNDLLALSTDYWKKAKAQLSEDKTRMQKTVEGVADISAIEQEIAQLPSREDADREKESLLTEIQALSAEISGASQLAKAEEQRALRAASLLRTVESAPALREQISRLEAAVEQAVAKSTVKHAAYGDALNEFKAASAALKEPAPASQPAPTLQTGDFSETGPGDYRVNATVRKDETGLTVLSVESWSQIIPNDESAEERARAREYELQQRFEEASDSVSKTENELRQANAELRQVQNQLTQAQAQFERTKVAAEELQAAGNDGSDQKKAPSADDISKLNAQLAEARTKYAKADQVVQAIIRFEQDKKRIEDAAAKRQALEAQIKTAGRVIDLLDQKKTEIVSLSIEAPLALANKLAAGILKGPLVFEQGEIGMRVGSHFVSGRVFSGTETAIVMMGLTAGLAHRSKLRVLLLDEIGRLDVENAVRLINNLDGMVRDGDIDQFILIGPSNPTLEDAIELDPSLEQTRATLNLIRVGSAEAVLLSVQPPAAK